MDAETPGSADTADALSDPGSLASEDSDGAASASGPASPATEPATPATGDPDVADDFAFAFDIDGVLVRGGDAIPEAVGRRCGCSTATTSTACGCRTSS